MLPEAEKDVVRQRVLDLTLYSNSYFTKSDISECYNCRITNLLGGQV